MAVILQYVFINHIFVNIVGVTYYFHSLSTRFPFSGKHLSKLNITATDTRDSEGLSTFHPYNLFITFFPGDSRNYYSTSVYPVKCCSKRSITFQVCKG